MVQKITVVLEHNKAAASIVEKQQWEARERDPDNAGYNQNSITQDTIAAIELEAYLKWALEVEVPQIKH